MERLHDVDYDLYEESKDCGHGNEGIPLVDFVGNPPIHSNDDLLGVLYKRINFTIWHPLIMDNLFDGNLCYGRSLALHRPNH